jgi:hypothetical protein
MSPVSSASSPSVSVASETAAERARESSVRAVSASRALVVDAGAVPKATSASRSVRCPVSEPSVVRSMDDCALTTVVPLPPVVETLVLVELSLTCSEADPSDSTRLTLRALECAVMECSVS